MNWLPWHGQLNPTPVVWTGQPTCVQWFDQTTSIASGESQSALVPPVLWT